jgi:hypothetical protein
MTYQAKQWSDFSEISVLAFLAPLDQRQGMA